MIAVSGTELPGIRSRSMECRSSGFVAVPGNERSEFGRDIRDGSAKRDLEACSESLEILIQGPQYGVGSQQH